MQPCDDDHDKIVIGYISTIWYYDCDNKKYIYLSIMIARDDNDEGVMEWYYSNAENKMKSWWIFVAS